VKSPMLDLCRQRQSSVALGIPGRRPSVLSTSDNGTIPIFATTEAHVDPGTHLITPETVAARLTSDATAVVPVHLFGGVADVAGFQDALDRAGRCDVKIIEDCAHGAGLSWDGRPVPLELTGPFSFNPAKNMGALGEAGAAVTDDEAFNGPKAWCLCG